MARNYDNTDLYFTRRGDFALSSTGDILDTSDDPLRSLVQEIRSRLQADKGDWSLYPQLGANLSAMIGESNNKITAEGIKSRVIASLSQFSLINTRDIIVTYIPITRYALLVKLSIKVIPTDENRDSTSVDIQVIYNYTDHNIHIL